MRVYHRFINGLIQRHRQEAANDARLAMLDDRARRGTLSPRNQREWAVRLEDRDNYRKSPARWLCKTLTRFHVWEAVWVLADENRKTIWRGIVSKF